jgi:hypothetical protein
LDFNKTATIKPIHPLIDDFLGARPQTPRVGFAEVWAQTGLLRSRITLFALLFLEKEEKIRD